MYRWKWPSATAFPNASTEAELGEILDNPPAWLVQSRANRTGKRPVWVHLECAVCGYEEAARPKKWWPEFTYVVCEHHAPGEVPRLQERLHQERIRRRRDPLCGYCGRVRSGLSPGITFGAEQAYFTKWDAARPSS